MLKIEDLDLDMIASVMQDDGSMGVSYYLNTDTGEVVLAGGARTSPLANGRSWRAGGPGSCGAAESDTGPSRGKGGRTCASGHTSAPPIKQVPYALEHDDRLER